MTYGNPGISSGTAAVAGVWSSDEEKPGEVTRDRATTPGGGMNAGTLNTKVSPPPAGLFLIPGVHEVNQKK